MRIPTHLAGHVVPVPPREHPDIERTFVLDSVLDSSPGPVAYEIHFFGEILIPPGDTDGRHRLIVGTRFGDRDHVPALVLARPVNDGGDVTGSDIVLFDGGRHGYDAMFAELHDEDALTARFASTRLEIDGETTFAVTVTVFDNIDWDEEEDDMRDEHGVLRLVTGEMITGERLRADGFDAIGVDVTDMHGVTTEIVNEELA